MELTNPRGGAACLCSGLSPRGRPMGGRLSHSYAHPLPVAEPVSSAVSGAEICGQHMTLSWKPAPSTKINLTQAEYSTSQLYSSISGRKGTSVLAPCPVLDTPYCFGSSQAPVMRGNGGQRGLASARPASRSHSLHVPGRGSCHGRGGSGGSLVPVCWAGWKLLAACSHLLWPLT